jgi:hypothetical protein
MKSYYQARRHRPVDRREHEIYAHREPPHLGELDTAPENIADEENSRFLGLTVEIRRRTTEHAVRDRLRAGGSRIESLPLESEMHSDKPDNPHRPSQILWIEAQSLQ